MISEQAASKHRLDGAKKELNHANETNSKQKKDLKKVAYGQFYFDETR